MTVLLTHTTTATGTDSGDGKISKNAWNEAHTLTMADARLLGRSAGSDGAAQEITVGAGLSLAAGALTSTVTGISDGDKGDITVSASGATWTIDNGVVTYAKMQDVSATSRILGRITAGAGDAEELTAANVKTILALAQADISGLTTADSPQFTAINLGHANDTTLTRVSAGVAAIEGVNILTTGNLSDAAYASSWDGVTTIAPSKNAVYDRLERAAHPGYKSAWWYLMTLKSGEIGAGQALSVDFIYYVPFFHERSVTLSDLGARVTTGAASGEIKLAIYAHDTSTGLPTGAPLAETAGIAATAAGAVSADITGANVTLDGGYLYWAAFRSNNSTIALQSALADAVVDWTRFVGNGTLSTLTSNATNVAPIISSAETYANAWPNAASETITVSGTSQGRSYALFGKSA